MIYTLKKICDDSDMADVEKKKKTVNVELTPRANAVVDIACDVHGMKKNQLVQRVLEWFAGQDKTLRSAMVGQFNEADVPAMARLILDRMAKPQAAAPGAPVELQDPVATPGLALEHQPNPQAAPKKKRNKPEGGTSAA